MSAITPSFVMEPERRQDSGIASCSVLSKRAGGRHPGKKNPSFAGKARTMNLILWVTFHDYSSISDLLKSKQYPTSI